MPGILTLDPGPTDPAAVGSSGVPLRAADGTPGVPVPAAEAAPRPPLAVAGTAAPLPARGALATVLAPALADPGLGSSVDVTVRDAATGAHLLRPRPRAPGHPGVDHQAADRDRGDGHARPGRAAVHPCRPGRRPAGRRPRRRRGHPAGPRPRQRHRRRRAGRAGRPRRPDRCGTEAARRGHRHPPPGRPPRRRAPLRPRVGAGGRRGRSDRGGRDDGPVDPAPPALPPARRPTPR